MFAFPRATNKVEWSGQGELIGDLIPYFGGGSLGVCFGVSTAWLKQYCPFDDCKEQIKKMSHQIIEVQGEIHMQTDRQYLLNTLATAAEGVMGEGSCFENKYDSGVASHIILEILQGTNSRNHIVSFGFEGAPKQFDDDSESGAHAIGVAATSSFLLMDPNYGVGKYSSKSALCSDLHDLLKSYVGTTGHLSESYLISFEDAFGDFVGAQ